MSYIDDFDDNVTNSKKIPYDDIPISRNVNSRNRKNSRMSISSFKVLVALVSILFICNVVLCGTLFYYMRNGKVDNINVYYNEINATEESISTVASNTALKSAVNVAAGGSCNDEYSFYNYTSSKGGGIIHSIDTESKTIYFVTCYHVIDGYTKDGIWVLLPTRLVPIKVSVVSYSSHYDIAVLKYRYTESNVNSFLKGCLPVTVYDSTYLSLGDTVFAVGNPLSNGFSITKGSISRLNTLMTVESNDFKTREIQIDAAINKGNSGGGLFNAEGKFIGLVNSKLVVTGVEGTSYAIPGNLVMGIAGSIIRNNQDGASLQKATYIDLGVEFSYDEALNISFVEKMYDDQLKTLLSYNVVVDSVSSDSILKGSIGKDDLIVSIEIYVYDGDEIKKVAVDMYNKYVFEDYSFSIVENTEIVFYIKKDGFGEVKKITGITVNENDFKKTN